MKCVNPRCESLAGPSLLCTEHHANAVAILRTLSIARTPKHTREAVRAQRRRERLWALGLTSRGTPRRASSPSGPA